MSLEIKLQVFEGPMDLLMHLIDKNQIDIYDIPIVTITEQYMEYINAMQKEDMEVTSEFLVMAATLIDIKCKMLLPKEVNEDGEEEDPRAELVEKLLEYKMYKYMAYELKDRQMDAGLSWYRQKNIPKEVKEYEAPIDFSNLIGDATLSKLNEIFQELLKRQEDKVDPIRSKFGNIEKETVDMDAKTLYIKAYIREHKSFSFRQLLEKQHNKTEIIVTFLIVLEEMKLGEIEIRQDGTFADIIITSRKAS
ncbi:MAG: segregation/condensation protein A [Butyrivibrio sp.]|uniref:segregation and condensation protein A n=1 Tax=Butyrivibrio sp. TaxID=28121 RepID=UPI001B014895|nr:segregation/condensation protein A [Butyrivibrio sp.]MBO6242150.1 segregation/condensation protein A [Butyrivibrio sp.]